MLTASNRVSAWRRATKRKLAKGLGGKCNRCGYSKCLAALDFHHRNPQEKSFSIGQALSNPRSWSQLVKEVRKCVLLCGNCHTEYHEGLWGLEEIEVQQFLPSEQKQQPQEATGSCPVCRNPVFMNRICCSYECAAKKARKVDWPEHQELVQLVDAYGKAGTARKFGVSEAAVRKRLRKFQASR